MNVLLKFLFFIAISFEMICFQSCITIVSTKKINKLSNDMAYDKGIIMLHQRSMTTQNLDSVYCNLNLFLETMAYYRTDLKNIQFNNRGVENVKNELIRVYDTYRRGDKAAINVYTELELRELVSEYLKAVIDDAKSGATNYKVKTMPQLLDGRPH